jgi:hypothetical protein
LIHYYLLNTSIYLSSDSNNTTQLKAYNRNTKMATPIIQCTPLAKDTRPTHLTLATLHKELNSYAVTQKTTRGGGTHGYLALLMTAAEYAVISPTAFIVPVHPGQDPVHAANATVAQITETNRAYASNLAQFTAYHEVEFKLKTMILEAVPHTFIQILESQQFGFAQISARALVAHLDATYGEVTHEDLMKNLDQMNKPWDVSTPMENLWTQIQQARNYAAADNAITETTALLSATQILTATGLFTQAFEQWRGKAKAEQTYPNFMKHFTLANNNRLYTTTTSEAGYSAALKNNEKENNPRNANTSTGNQQNAGTVVGYHYCWTHGVNKTHQGLHCTYPKDGHIKNATIGNMQGGCGFIFVPVAKRPNRQKPPTAATTTTIPE